MGFSRKKCSCRRTAALNGISLDSRGNRETWPDLSQRLVLGFQDSVGFVLFFSLALPQVFWVASGKPLNLFGVLFPSALTG